ncbi:MAG TPA: SH3 domain-containing protein [Polaromonas sp.]|uniref:SH3 domain-containing protein n=1 Tax=Polaromonas sp. TaxID=1869339 RepID=UPI002D2AF044|nr:SH3 domain-containing protein [Polaromonas sp.]HYW56771.1 SH3 domain-containing protein [Polaromonas sp.]
MILSKIKRVHWLGICALTLASSMAHAQSEPVLLKRPSELREAPGENSRSLVALAERTPLTRSGARQGAWVQVKTEQGATGWVHMFDIGSSSGAAPAGAGASALRGLTSFFNKGSAQGGSTTATSTVGIRGLGAEDLNRSQPSIAAVDQADGMRMNADQARQFAGNASLAARTVDPLPEPAPVRNATPSSPSSQDR